MKGSLLREPESKYVRDGIFELRIVFSNDTARVFYFFFKEKRIIVTNGFIKKTRKLPVREIERAIRYKADYEERQDSKDE